MSRRGFWHEKEKKRNVGREENVREMLAPCLRFDAARAGFDGKQMYRSSVVRVSPFVFGSIDKLLRSRSLEREQAGSVEIIKFALNMKPCTSCGSFVHVKAN